MTSFLSASKMQQEVNKEKHIDISRIKKNIFSNPFNFQKLGIPMAQTCFHRQMKHNYRLYPLEFTVLKEQLRENAKLVCYDDDCYPSICHKLVLQRFLNKI